MKLILASGSPRRKEILGAAGYDFTVHTADVDETLPEGMPASEGVRLLAVRKGDAVARLLGDEVPILSADTLVELDGKKLGKPKDAEDAARMLRALSGRAHAVDTGVAVHYKGKCVSAVAATKVIFRPLSEEEIAAYVASGEPMDKAGAYAIQGLGGALVAGYDGDMDTVVGLSMRTVKRLLAEVTGESSDEA
ncbi:MAG TPA: septum formation protein Maf [Clostridiales bacterium]|nr:septum formation protein Maf [Clostridiales bacterium]